MAFEEANEIGRVRKSYFGGYLRNVELRFEQEGLGALHFLRQHILYGRHPHCLAKPAYEVRLRQAGAVGQLIYADGLAKMLLHIVEQEGKTVIVRLETLTGMLDEIRQKYLHQAVELHAFVGLHLHECLGVFTISLMIEEGLGGARGKMELGVEVAIVFKEEACRLIGFHLARKLIAVEESQLLLLALEDEEVVEVETGFALVGMWLVGGEEIEMVGRDLHIAIGQMDDGPA